LLDNPGTDADETDPSVNFRIAPLRGIRYNTIINNGGYGIHARGQYADSVSFNDNNLFGNGIYDFYLATNQDVDVAENYWGDTPLSQVPVRIYDCNDLEFGCPDADNQVGSVTYLPVSAAPIAEAPAFVQSVTVDPALVGIQQATFDVSFSRAMDQGVPPDISFHSVKRGTSTTFTESDGLAENKVTEIALDRQGNL
jgi:hypothetical protein